MIILSRYELRSIKTVHLPDSLDRIINSNYIHQPHFVQNADFHIIAVNCYIIDNATF